MNTVEGNGSLALKSDVEKEAGPRMLEGREKQEDVKDRERKRMIFARGEMPKDPGVLEKEGECWKREGPVTNKVHSK